jgi:hypothetical protein
MHHSTIKEILTIPALPGPLMSGMVPHLPEGQENAITST